MNRRAPGFAPLTLLLVLSALGAPSAAGAAQIVTIATPSVNVNPADVVFNGAEHPRELRANVLLPDGYDGKRSFPVLYLLHGVGDAYDTWAKPSRGDILETAKGLGAIIVMPEGAKGFYSNWWNGGMRGKPGWERYFLDALIPLVERRFKVMPGRSSHAIAGNSMGGMGSTYLASQRPDYFGSVATFSGFVSHQRPETELGLRLVGGVEYTDIFGPQTGFYATGHNPARLTSNLRFSRLYVAVGNGLIEPGVQSEPAAIVGGGAVEAGLRPQSEELVTAARASGVDVTYVPRNGVHDWPYWRANLRDAIAWGLFKPVAEKPVSWSYSTTAKTGIAWGLSYAFDAPPEQVQVLERDDAKLVGRGAGSVTVTTKDGCVVRAALPFEIALPLGNCTTRLLARVTLSPRSIQAARRTRLKIKVAGLLDGHYRPLRGAVIRFRGQRTKTSRNGRATLTVRVARPGRYLVTAKLGRLVGNARLTVR